MTTHKLARDIILLPSLPRWFSSTLLYLVLVCQTISHCWEIEITSSL